MKNRAELRYDLAKTVWIAVVAITVTLSLGLFSAYMANNQLFVRILAVLTAFAFMVSMLYFRRVQKFYDDLKKRFPE